MSIPSGHARISLTGTLPSNEVFDTSFWVLGYGGSLASLQTLADDIAALITATDAFQYTLGLLDTGSQYATLRAYGYESAGGKATYVAESDLSLSGTTSALHCPLQTCVVVSLRTTLAGRSYRGRMYLPATAAILNQFALITEQGVLATEWAGLLSGVNALTLSGGGNPTVSVVSQTLTTSTPVSSVKVGNRPDVQRRRANGVAETYATTDLT